MRQLQTSTVAMAIYNTLAVECGGPRTHTELARGIASWVKQSGITVTGEQFAEALKQLVARGYLRVHHKPDEDGNQLYDLVDAKRRPIVTRDRSDAGKENAGWNDWKAAAHPVARTRSIEDVIRG